MIKDLKLSDFIESPDFMRADVIKGLRANLTKLQKVRSGYTKFGNNIQYIKLLVDAEKMIINEINFHEGKN